MPPLWVLNTCKIFETVSTFLEWAVKFKTQHDTVHYYLDDFIFISKSNSDNFSTLIFFDIHKYLEIQTMFIPKYEKIPNVVYGDFALQQTLKVTE